ncbi:hypothetical protein LCGC14_1419180 [marine sediment metagenome]|uniref:Terminase large subunit gp17-like C-terminal domain-containing protein n=1 Tax=marine sediment metagenome TaxID=412755 RepID=A0A0F9M7E0_9ZZZZ
MPVVSKTTIKLMARGKRAEKDFREFVRFIGGFDPIEHQKEQMEACQDIGDNPKSGRKYIVVAPPGSGKSLLIGVLFVAWMIGKYPDEHIGLLSYADKPAWKQSAAIRRIIEKSKPYHFTFPGIGKDPSSWGSSEFKINRKSLIDQHPTLRCGGTQSAVVSYRMSGLVFDDPISEKQSRNAEQLEKAWDNYLMTITTRLIDNAWQMVIGTRWVDDDFIGSLLLRKLEGWKIIHIRALKSDGTTYWPPDGKYGYSQKFMEDKKTLDPELFQVAYMGEPGKEGTGIIKKLPVYREVPSLEMIKKLDLLVAVGWDTAYKDKEKNDYTVGYVGGLDAYGVIWILDRRKGRFTTPKLIEQIYEIQEEWNPYEQWVEDSGGGTPAVQIVVAETPGVPLTTVTPTQGGKRSRAHALVPYIKGGRVSFARHATWFENSRYNLTRFPFITHDDDIDALWVLVSNLVGMTHPAEYEKRETRRLRMR